MGHTEFKTLFEYDDYRVFLNDFYHAAKARDSKFSFRFFSQQLGFKSSGMLKMIIDGQRSITAENIPAFTKVLKLNKEEAVFFRNLVHFNQAKTAEVKQSFARELLKSRSYRKIHPLSATQYSYFASWYFAPVRELVNLADFSEDPQWIARQITPQISTYEAKRAVDEMLKLGILKRNEQGRLVQSDSIISTVDSITTSSLVQFHREMMKRAAESIDAVPRDKRELNAITMSISSKTVEKIKEMTDEFRKRIAELAALDGAPDSVYQLNLHFFPLVFREEEKKN